MNWRMLTYYALIRQRYPKRTLFQRILYVGERPWRAQPVITEPCLRFRYEVTDMRSIDCQELLASPVLEGNILAVLCRMPDRRKGVHDILYRISMLPTHSNSRSRWLRGSQLSERRDSMCSSTARSAQGSQRSRRSIWDWNWACCCKPWDCA
ncbi:MAG: hypothetical protein HQL66_09835 [Magnetococcales bacterium]|nr:hypothetical protein [Magnetococcales bacterium]